MFLPPPLKGAGSVERGGGRFCQLKPESGKHGLEKEKEKKKRTIFSKYSDRWFGIMKQAGIGIETGIETAGLTST